jgi:hypothetical protein
MGITANGNEGPGELKRVSGTAHVRFEKCEIAAIGSGAESNINMIAPKISHSRPEELEIHHREKSKKWNSGQIRCRDSNHFAVFPFIVSIH